MRDYTKGHPPIEANNHPIRHGAVVGVHNGIIFNDDELMAEHGFERAEPKMTVDSEAIFALAEAAGGDRAALEELRGSMADRLARRAPPETRLSRPRRRPAALDSAPARHELFFASTKAALEVVERYLRLKLRKREVGEGTSRSRRRRPRARARALPPQPGLRGPPRSRPSARRTRAAPASSSSPPSRRSKASAYVSSA